MNRPVSLALLVFGLCAFPASAVLDSNQNGLSNLWEMQYSGGTLPNPGFDPLDDPDADGWTNAQEATAGTSPFDANAPDGIVRPQITHIPEVLGVTPEAVIITWPTNLGKQYTLLYSPDLVEWLTIPNETFIGNGSVVEYNFTISQDDKLFWRVQIEDADSDGDGLTNTEEHELGTDPNNSQSVAGFPDMWLATHFLNTLMNGGPSSFDPNGDSDHDGLTNSEEYQKTTDPNNPDTDADYLMDGWEVDHGFDPTNPDENNNGILDGLDDNDGDGLTNEQEQAVGTDPAVEDGDDIGKEAIINGDFSLPAIGSSPSNTSDSTWDYWAEGVDGWEAVTGNNIELQNIESTGTNGQYAELKAHPEGHHGIYQEVATRVGVTYLLALDCKIRKNTTAYNNMFSIKIDGGAVQSITPTSTWATQVVPFVATKVLTKIEFVPENGLDDTMGCLVDNVKLAPIEIVPDNNMSGVIGDVVKSTVAKSNIKHFVTPKAAQEYVILKVTGLTAEQISPGANQIFEWNNTSVGEAVTGEPLKWRVKRDDAKKYPLKIKKKNVNTDVAEMDVWVTWATIETTDDSPFMRLPSNADPAVIKLRGEIDYKFTCQPSEMFDLTADVPDLASKNSVDPPGGVHPWSQSPLKNGADIKYDASRQFKVSTVCSVSSYHNELQASGPDVLNFPQLGTEGNDDPDTNGETPPYLPRGSKASMREADHPFADLEHSKGVAGATFEEVVHFKEFARVQIGSSWYICSDPLLSKLTLKAKHENGKWVDDKSEFVKETP